MKPSGSAGSPASCGPDQARQAHHSLGGQRLVRDERQLAVLEARRVARDVQLDPAFVEKLAHRLGGGGAEQLERRLLGGHERQPHLPQATLGHMRSGHQGELVEG